VVILPYDVVIIAESGRDGLTGIIPDRLTLDGMPASIQVASNYVLNQGQVIRPVAGEGVATWWSAPKLNGLYLYGFLTRHGHNCLLVNKYYPERERADEAISDGPACVVISTTFIRSRQALAQMVQDIRAARPDVFIVVGGPFVYLSYLVKKRSSEPGYLKDEAREDYLFFQKDDPQVDLYVVSLLGDKELLEIVTMVKAGSPPEGLTNTAALVGDRYLFGPRDEDVSAAPSAEVDWEVLPEEVFRSGVVPIQASKGCPYKCAFCSFVKDRRMIYVKPVERLLAELRAVTSRGARYVWFVDDNFRLGMKDLNLVCRRIIDEGLDFRWMTMIRASALKDADITLMKESGCMEVQLGLESADPRILAGMNKGADPAVYRDVVGRLLAAGINCSCYFIFGFPGETDESAMTTRAFIRELEHPELEGFLTWSLFPFCLYPMSPVYEPSVRLQYGLEGHLRRWRHATMDCDRAMYHVREAFMELDRSAPVYRGDNLDILYRLTPSERRLFLAGRHRISKASIERPPTRQELLSGFSAILPKDIKTLISRSVSPPPRA
jgi:radical SAM superfamily enzyme YgiQ (UPF0313 family)